MDMNAMTMEQSSDLLAEWLAEVPAKIGAISDERFADQPTGKWSRKQEFGHLVDSACNNLQRFVRGQYEDNPHIIYNPDEWVSLQQHQHRDKASLVELWVALNRQILWVVSHIPLSRLDRTCDTAYPGSPPGAHTLEWLFCDYVEHMKHHLDHLLRAEHQV